MCVSMCLLLLLMLLLVIYLDLTAIDTLLSSLSS